MPWLAATFSQLEAFEMGNLCQTNGYVGYRDTGKSEEDERNEQHEFEGLEEWRDAVLEMKVHFWQD